MEIITSKKSDGKQDDNWYKCLFSVAPIRVCSDFSIDTSLEWNPLIEIIPESKYSGLEH